MRRSTANELLLFNPEFVPEILLNESASAFPEDTFFTLLPVVIEDTKPQIIVQPYEYFKHITEYEEFSSSYAGPWMFDEQTIKIAEFQTLTLSSSILNPENKVDPTNLSDLTFIWRKNDIIIANSGNRKHVEAYGERLVFDLLQKEDSGTYTCEIINKSGISLTDAITLQVINPYENRQIAINLIKNGYASLDTNDWQVVNQDVVAKPYGLKKPYKEVIEHDNEFTFFNDGYDDINQYQKSLYNDFISPFLSKSMQDAVSKSLGDHFDPETFIEDGAINPHAFQQATASLADFTNEDSPYKRFVSFNPNPVFFDRFNNDVDIKYPNTINDKIGNFYFTRPSIKYFRDNGHILAQAYQDIVIEDAQELMKGYIKGVQYLSGVFFCYLGNGITRIESSYFNTIFTPKFEESCQVFIDIYNDNKKLTTATQYSVESPTPQDLFSSLNLNKINSSLDVRGYSTVACKRIIIPQIPIDTTHLRVTMMFKLESNQQSDENIIHQANSIHLGPSYGNDASNDENSPMGNSRTLITATNLYLYPNNDALQKFKIPTLSSGTTNIISQQ